MQALSDIAIYLLQSLGGLYVLIVLMRFLLQVARADFYNPVSQFVVRATNAPLRPLRRFIPGYRGYDIASLLLMLLVQLVTVYASALLAGVMVQPHIAIAWSMIGLVSMLMYVYLVCLFAVVILSWVAPFSMHPLAMLVRQLLQPLLVRLQRIIPPMGGIDISPMFVFLGIGAVRIGLEHLAVYLQLMPPLVPGI